MKPAIRSFLSAIWWPFAMTACLATLVLFGPILLAQSLQDWLDS